MLKRIALIILSLALFPSLAEARHVGVFGLTDVYYESPIWSKDGSRIYFIKTVEHVRPTWAFSGWPNEYTAKLECYVMSMRPDGSNKKVIAKFITKHGSLKYIHDLVISPDGKMLFFYMLSSSKEISGIYKIKVDKANLEKVVNFEFYGQLTPFFLSPDGKRIAYTKYQSDKSDSTRSCWVVDLNGQNNHMIYGEDSYVKGWIADGKIVVSKYGGHSYDIYDPLLNSVVKKVNTLGLDDKELAKSLNIIKKTYISSDGKKEIFGGTEELGVMDIDGKNKKILLKGKVH